MKKYEKHMTANQEVLAWLKYFSNAVTSPQISFSVFQTYPGKRMIDTAHVRSTGVRTLADLHVKSLGSCKIC